MVFLLSGKCCNKIPILINTEDRRISRVFKKLGPIGYLKILVVIGSREFQKCFALDSQGMASSGRDITEDKFVDGMVVVVVVVVVVGDEGESRHSRDENPRSESSRDKTIEYIGTIRKEMKRILPCLPDLTPLRWFGE